MNGHFTSEKVEAKHRAVSRLTKGKKLCRIRDSIAKEVQCKHKRATANVRERKRRWSRGNISNRMEERPWQ